MLGRLAGVPVAVLQGRAHLYEGDIDGVRTPVRALRAAGAEIVVLTNAAGSLRPDLRPGPPDGDRRPHQPDRAATRSSAPTTTRSARASPAWATPTTPSLRAALHAAADEQGVALAEGVYLGVTGPSFETPAEIRAFRTLGADAVGMSTVHEAIVARHCGLRVAAVSTITNLAEGLTDEPLTHEGTLRDAQRAAGDLARVLHAFLERL